MLETFEKAAQVAKMTFWGKIWTKIGYKFFCPKRSLKAPKITINMLFLGFTIF